MNKYMWFALTVIYILVVTIIVDASEAFTTYEATSGVASNVYAPTEQTWSAAWSFLRTFTKILTFDVEGFPPKLSLLLFHPVVLANGVLLLDIVKDLVPFT